MEISVKQGDTDPAPTIDCSYTDGYNFVIPDFTGAAAAFSMRDASGTVLIDDAPAVIVAPTVTAAVLTYNWGATDTVLAVATYYAEFHVTYASGKKGTFPTDKDDPYIRVVILEKVGGA